MRLLTAALCLAIACLPADGDAGERRLLVRVPDGQLEAVSARHGLSVVRRLGANGPFLMQRTGSSSSLDTLLGDPDVEGAEENAVAETVEASAARLQQSTAAILDQSTAAILDQSTAAILDGLDRTPMAFFDGTAWAGYVYQPAADLIGAPEAHLEGATGRGVTVAVIDTGVDPRHPMLAGALLPGYDFTRDTEGASEWADLDQSTAAILDQSTAAILDQSTAAILDGATPTRLSQSTAAILDQSTAAILDADGLPAAFGHGTLVAGLVHLVAPEARILPLKAFDADGFSTVADIVAAIHYAVDAGADVINMSFNSDSLELLRAVTWASRRGVICVASVGNEGVRQPVLPAALPWVVGVASTTLVDERAPFSNYGRANVRVAAPGVDVITAYPGGHYAAASGTSFSTGLVSGMVALLEGADGDLARRELARALRASQFISRDMGHGRIELLSSLATVH